MLLFSSTTRSILWVSLVVMAVAVIADPACRFAHTFRTADIMHDERVRRLFLLDFARAETLFMKGIGINQQLQMTYDGHRLHLTTGLPLGKPHLFSAASKESLHVGVLARILYDAARNVSGSIAAQLMTPSEALQIASTKVASFERFNAQFPGFGGYLPWFAYEFPDPSNTSHDSPRLVPAWNWQNKVPALDNGELFWAAYALAHVIEKHYSNEYTELAQRWRAVYQRMIDNGPRIFYAGNGTISAVVSLTNQSLPVDENTYTGSGALDDPYEGELVTVAFYLFANLTVEEQNMLWVRKRAMLQAVNLTVSQGNITVQRGWWFSAHEQWKYLMLPYHLSSINWRVFRNGERARTWYTSAGGGEGASPSPGMWASVNGPVPSNHDNFPYYSACGVQPIAFERVLYDSTITPYSCFPLFLAHPATAAGWLHNMMLTRKGQNCWGTTESFNVSGATVAPLTTWDSKITTLLSVIGGIADINAEALAAQQQLDTFVSRIDFEWLRVFGSGPLYGEDLAFLPPVAKVPEILDDFTSCSTTSTPCG